MARRARRDRRPAESRRDPAGGRGDGAAGALLPERRVAPLTRPSRERARARSSISRSRRSRTWSRALETLKERGFWVHGADPGEGTSTSTRCPTALLEGRLVLVLGAEGTRAAARGARSRRPLRSDPDARARRVAERRVGRGGRALRVGETSRARRGESEAPRCELEPSYCRGLRLRYSAPIAKLGWRSSTR